MDSVISRQESLAQQVRDYVYDKIITGDLVASETYSVSELSHQLGVSRTPVREAVLQLEEIGLVAIVRNKGFRVVEVSAEDIVSAFQMRYLLEPFSAARAAQQTGSGRVMAELRRSMSVMVEASASNDRRAFMAADKEFHDLLLDQGENSRLTQAVNTARDATYSRGLSTRSLQRTWNDIHEEHERILRAIDDSDAEEAAGAMRDHIRATGEHLLQRMGHALHDDWLGAPLSA